MAAGEFILSTRFALNVYNRTEENENRLGMRAVLMRYPLHPGLHFYYYTAENKVVNFSPLILKAYDISKT